MSDTVDTTRYDGFMRATLLRLRDKYQQYMQQLQCERGATMLEWVLLLGAIAIPSYVILRFGLEILLGHFGLLIVLNSMPFP